MSAWPKNPLAPAMLKTELAWAAGFFDGEGCSTISKQASQYTTTSGELRQYTGVNKYPRLSLSQKEEQPLQRFLSAVGEGKIYGPYKGRDILHWHLVGAKTERVMAKLLPYLSEPKRAQWMRVLEEVSLSS